MNTNDLIRNTNNNGHDRFWEITEIAYGGTGQESIIEMVPVGEIPNHELWPTRVPICILEAAIRTGAVKHYSRQNADVDAPIPAPQKPE
jgi:hypothetical protein